jgi:hypothetical protein
MAAIKKRISALVNKQLPDFISAEYPKFSAFLQKYYEQLELRGQPLDIIQNLTQYTDIDFYEKSLLSEFTECTANIAAGDTVITLENTDSFPETNGYVLIDDEVIFYGSKTATTLVNCVRNVSGTTKLGDLYNASRWTTGNYGNGVEHLSGATVYNISNLFLYAFVKNYETQYLASFPEESLKPEVDKRTLIKNIKQFYRAKGTEQSINFIFNSIVAQDAEDIPSIYYPKDSTLKASTSDWINKFALRVKVLSGDPNKVIGQRLSQEVDTYDTSVGNALATIDNVNFLGNFDGESIYEIALAPETIVGEFSIAQKSFLTSRLLPSVGAGNRIDVFSTTGWKTTKGKLQIGSETFTYRDKNVNQFTVDSRTGNGDWPVNTPVYNYANLTASYEEDGVEYTVRFICYGILYGLKVSSGNPYSTEGDVVQISDSGFETRNPVIYDKTKSDVRWKLNNNIAKSGISGLTEVLTDVQAIYEDEQYYYIASSGLPTYSIGTFTNLTPQDQKFLKLIRKESIRNTELYPTPTRDIGIFLNGVLAYGYKDYDENDVVFGGLTHFTVTEKGSGYKAAPFVLIDGDKEAVGKAKLSGEVVESIEVVNPGKNYTTNPAVTITSGRGAIVTATVTKDKVTQLTIVDPGEYYSSPPLIVIRDSLNNGRLAQYTSIVSTEGKLIGFNKISEGKFYTQANVSVEVVAVGKGAEATASIKRWKKNRFEVNNLDSENGYLFENFTKSFGYGYAHVGNPVSLRTSLGDTNSNQHSPIIGYAYDGNPIYGPYGYDDPLDPASGVERMTSSWRIKAARDSDGPDVATYPLGSFIADYRYQHRFGTLDENNGRYCVTPDYPNGVYAYFITMTVGGTPVFPYILGERFYSIPVESNYNSSINQLNVPSRARRLKTSLTPNNGVSASAVIETTIEGSVTSSTVESSPSTFSIGSKVFADNRQTEGGGLVADVSSLKGKQIASIESTQVKAVKITSKNPVYFFDKSIITQEGTNASGEVVGDIFSSNDFVLRNVTGTFDTVNKLNSGLRVLNLIVDTESFFSSNTVVRLTNGTEATVLSITSDTLRVAFNPFEDGDGISFPQTGSGISANTIYYVINSTANSFQISTTPTGNPVSLTTTSSFGVVATSEIGRGLILEQVNAGNTVKVRVDDGDFITSLDFYLRSEVIDDTVGARISQVDELSKGVEIFNLNDNIGLVTTTENHNVTVDDKVTIDIIPNQANSTTDYHVRRRIYQTVKLFAPSLNTTIDDTGIGVTKLLNGGADYTDGVYTDVELLFADQTRTRNAGGFIVDAADSYIGAPGAEGNAKATITVSNGAVTNVAITTKGATYQIGDILVVDDADLQRLAGSVSQSYLYIEVTHVGFGINNTILTLADASGVAADDILKINKEKVKVTSVTDNHVTVIRGVENTTKTNHFNGNAVTFDTAKYIFNEGTQLGGTTSSPIVKSYDSTKQELTVIYNLDQSLDSIEELNFNSTFTDDGTPSKLVIIDSVVSPAQFKFEFSKYTNAGPWTPNPIIKVQKYYRYKFITSDPSMGGSFLEFSPSRNKNILTTESIRGSLLPGTGDANTSFVMVTFGFGDASPSNTYTEKQPIDFTNYYYFDKAGVVSSDDAYLSIIDDPLQGEKTVNYVSPLSFAYDLSVTPEYDGTGTYSYTTNSIFATGEIDKVSIVNSGKQYKKVPTTFGVLPSETNTCLPVLNYDRQNNKIVSISIGYAGRNYSKPVIALIDAGETLFLNFNIVVGVNGDIVAIQLLQDYTFTSEPLIYVLESDVKVYFNSKTIGYPNNVTISYNGAAYYNDASISSIFTSHQILQVTNLTDKNFLNGEVIKQYEGGFLIAEGQLAKDGYNPKKNFLKVKNVVGEFKSGLPVTGTLLNRSADVTNVFTSIFSPEIKSYYDNAGYFDTNRGQPSAYSQKMADSFFYQDYSYVVKSKTPINIWKKLVKQTVHPSGFKMFGEVAIDATASTQMPEKQNIIENVSILELWDPEKNKVTIRSTRQQITQSTISVRDTNIQRGRGSVLVSGIDTTELLSYQFELQQPFDGDFDQAGNIVGTTSFNMILPGSGILNVANQNNLFITIDGVVQEPGVAYTVSGSTITFAKAPLGPRRANNQDIEAQKFVGRLVRFKNDALNNQYFRKIKNIQEQFDGVSTRFALYYEDGTDVILDAKENLLVSLDGVIQENKMTPLIPAFASYYIDRTQTPNDIVFIDAPRRLDDVNYTRFFAYSVGNYERLQLETDLYNGVRKGPFTMRTVLGNQTVTVNNDRTILVFIEGVLQIRNRAYSVTGSQITFAEPPRPGQIINILYLYGRETERKLTFYNFENNKFFNRIDLVSDAIISNEQLLEYNTVYQGNSFSEWTAVGEILNAYASTDGQGNPTLRIIFRQQNFKFDTQYPIKLTSYKKSVSEFTINPTNIVSITDYIEDDERNQEVFKTKAGWMFGTELSPTYKNNINVGDKIKVDGEKDYREVLLVPEILKKLGHRRQDLIKDNHWGQVGVTDYNGQIDGIGLSVLAQLTEGKVTSITWNQRNYAEYAYVVSKGIIIPKVVTTRSGLVFLDITNKVLLRSGEYITATNPNQSVLVTNPINIQPNAFGYSDTPKLVFVPQPPRDEYGNITGPVTGGGAAGFVVMDRGEIIDVVLTNAGSGYSAPPKVYITRGYNILRSPDRVVESRTDLFLQPTINAFFTVTTQFLLDIGSKAVPDYTATIATKVRYDSTNPTIIVTPAVKDASIVEAQREIVSILDAAVADVNSIVSISYNRKSTIVQPINVESSSTVTKLITVFADFGTCDVYSSGVDVDKYEFGQLGNRFSVYENIKFSLDLGVASYAGQSISQQNTLQEIEIYYPTITIGDFADRSESSLGANGANWQLTWPTINEYGAILDSSLSDTDTTVYVPSTDRFPSSGKLLINGEVVTYDGKLSDRFTGVRRGFNNNIGAWDINSASHLGVTFNVSAQEAVSGPRDIYISPDGNYMYIVGTASDSVHQYNLAVSWDITSAVFANTFSIVSEEFNPQGLFFKPDGTEMYVSGNSSVSFAAPANQRIYQYTLTTPWDISTASYSNNSFDVNTGVDQAPTQLYIKSDGVTLFVLGGGIDNAREVFKYTMSTPWDISSSVYDNVSFNVDNEDDFPLGIDFKPDGSKFFVVGTQNDTVYEYTMATAWDITTASYTGNRILSGNLTNPHGIYVQPQGDKFFVIDNSISEVYEYSMTRGVAHNAGDYLRSLV